MITVMHPELETWERFSDVGARAVVPHYQTGLAPTTPVERIAQLNSFITLLRVYLGDACAEIRRLEHELARQEHASDVREMAL